MPDSLYYEQKALTDNVKKELTAMGYALVDKDAELRILGIAEGIMIDNRNKIVYGASDPRGGGLAAGY
jgi:gamma-glutamyltranspeptidase